MGKIEINVEEQDSLVAQNSEGIEIINALMASVRYKKRTIEMNQPCNKTVAKIDLRNVEQKRRRAAILMKQLEIETYGKNKIYG